jgi:hypothetical protein
MFGVNMLASVCERQTLSKRIIRYIPKKLILRIPAFLLYSGPAGGVILSMLMLTATLVTYSLLSKTELSLPKAGSHSGEELFLIAIGLALYACCYSLTSLDAKTIFFKKTVSTRSTVIGIVAFLIVGSILPVIIGFLLRQNLWQELSPLWYIGNPLVLFLEKKIWVECFTFTSIWAIIVFSLSVPWFYRQIRGFKPA